jgi:hypothetical protein
MLAGAACELRLHCCENGKIEQVGKVGFGCFLKKRKKISLEREFLGKVTLTGFRWLGI